MIWLEIRNLRLVVLVISMLFKKSIQNKPEYEFSPTLSFEPVTFVQHEDKQSNTGFSTVNTPKDNKLRPEDIVPNLNLAEGHRRVNRQAIPGQFGHAQVPTSYSQHSFNSAPAKYPGDQLLSYPSYSNSNPSLQYPQNNMQLGQSAYNYALNQRPGYNQAPSNFQSGQIQYYPSNSGSNNHQSPNYTRPGYAQPSAPNAVTPGYNQYQQNHQPGQLPQYSPNQRPGYSSNQYSSNSQIGQAQQYPGIVTPSYQRYPSYNQSGHTSQYPTNKPGYYQYPSNTPPNTNPYNYQAGHGQQYPVPMRPGDSPSLMYSTTPQPGYHQYPNSVNRFG